MSRKRALDADSHTPNGRTSEAASFKNRIFKKLKNAFESDAEVDFLSIIPSDYSTRLAQRKESVMNDSSKLVDLTFVALYL